jgi:hypothetical protein
VQAGGDQGRDFESYRTYLSNSHLRNSSYAALTDNRLIVGACTLNKQVEQKIKSDLATIFGTGEKPDHVAYFCEPDLPVAKRHALQAHCQQNYNATLDIFDGQAITDLLSDRETFWVAEQFLEIPADAWPSPSSLDDHYNVSRERWLSNTEAPRSYADFLDIKHGLRTAASEAEARGDLDRWIQVMRLFLADKVPDRLTQKARYEIAVAELKGRGSIDPALPLIQAFFDRVSPDRPPVELLDASVLVIYTWSAQGRREASVTVERISAWIRKVENVLARARRDNPHRGDRCTLLEAQAMLAFIPRNGEPPSADVLSRFFKLWGKVIQEVTRTPLFPVTHISDILEIVSSFVGPDDRLRSLTDKVDTLVSKRAGAGAAAECARRRALSHFDAGRYVAAIDDLQRTKEGWFTGEHIDGSILAMLGICAAYEALQLHFASRYYAAGALFASLNHEDEQVTRRVSQAAFRLATTFHAAGEGLTFFHSVGAALIVHATMATNAHDWTKHSQVRHAVGHAAILRAVARRIAPELLTQIDAAIAGWPLTKEEQAAFVSLSEGEPWSEMTIPEIESRIARDLGRHPFGDVGAERSAAWSAFGVVWTVQSLADEETWLAALEVAAALQIIQVEFADVDLLIIPSRAIIHVEWRDIQKPEFHQLPDNGSLSWRISMPRAPDTSDRGPAGLAALAIMVLEQATALPSAKFQKFMRDRIQRGLVTRIHSVRPMRELMRFAMPEGIDLAAMSSLNRPQLNGRFEPIEATELCWRTGPGPGYSHALARKYLHNRYETTLRALRVTLPRLLGDTRCRNLVLQLRADSALDWQILTILANAVGQWQIEQKLRGPFDPEEFQRELKQRLFREERDDDPVFDLRQLTDTTLKLRERVLTAAALKIWDLECHRRTPDFIAMKRLLDERYRHSIDDIPHKDPFEFGNVA